MFIGHGSTYLGPNLSYLMTYGVDVACWDLVVDGCHIGHKTLKTCFGRLWGTGEFSTPDGTSPFLR